MLTSILETNQIFNETLRIYEGVFNLYFDQIEFVTNLIKTEPDTDIHKSEVWPQNMMVVSFLKNLGLNVFNKRALWNLLCAGTTFSYLCFFGNLEAGCSMIDSQAQLRITLHLFYTLKVLNGIIREGQVPVLDRLHRYFENNRGGLGRSITPKEARSEGS